VGIDLRACDGRFPVVLLEVPPEVAQRPTRDHQEQTAIEPAHVVLRVGEAAHEDEAALVQLDPTVSKRIVMARCRG